MIRHVIMDMDGVVYRGHVPVPGAIETLEALRQEGVQVAFLTNNASRHRTELAETLRRMGLPCGAEQSSISRSTIGCCTNGSRKRENFHWCPAKNSNSIELCGNATIAKATIQ